MSTPEERLRMAFDAVKVPGDLRQRTLAQIERNRPAVRPRQRQRLVWRLAAAAAAVLVIALLGWGGHSVYAAETAVVGIELNPALELGLNRFNIVVNARALNLEGEAVLSSVNVLGKSYDQAWDLVTTCPAFQSFLGEESFIDAYVVGADNQQCTQLLATTDAGIRALPCAGVCNLVTPELYTAARSYGVGVGRYEAALVLADLDPTLSLTDCLAFSMPEIRQRIGVLDPENSFGLPGPGPNGPGQPPNNGSNNKQQNPPGPSPGNTGDSVGDDTGNSNPDAGSPAAGSGSGNPDAGNPAAGSGSSNPDAGNPDAGNPGTSGTGNNGSTGNPR